MCEYERKLFERVGSEGLEGFTCKELDELSGLIRNRKVAIHGNEIDAFLERAKKNVGRCFKMCGIKKNYTPVYAKIIGVPKKMATKTDFECNEYQYPALYLGLKSINSFIPFYIDNFFSGIWGEGYYMSDVFGEWEEITSDEFDAEFMKRLERFKEKVSSIT